MADTNIIAESVQAFGIWNTPTAGKVIVTIPATSLPNGLYMVWTCARYGANANFESDMELRRDGVSILRLDVASVSQAWAPQLPVYLQLNGSQALSINAILGAIAAGTYKATLIARCIWQPL